MKFLSKVQGAVTEEKNAEQQAIETNAALTAEVATAEERLDETRLGMEQEQSKLTGNIGLLHVVKKTSGFNEATKHRMLEEFERRKETKETHASVLKQAKELALELESVREAEN